MYKTFLPSRAKVAPTLPCLEMLVIDLIALNSSSTSGPTLQRHHRPKIFPNKIVLLPRGWRIRKFFSSAESESPSPDEAENRESAKNFREQVDRIAAKQHIAVF